MPHARRVTIVFMGSRKDYQQTPHAVIKTCEVCGEEFRVMLSTLKTPGYVARFCGRACSGKWRKGKNFAKPSAAAVKLPSLDEIGAAYTSGQSMQQIANTYGVSIQAVVVRLDKIGIQRRPPTGASLRTPEAQANKRTNQAKGKSHPLYKDVPIENLIEGYKEGKSLSELQQLYGLSEAGIARRLKQNGVTMRRPGFSRYRKCSDGHIVQSQWEQAVDEWLTKHGLNHTIHPVCPWSKWPNRQLGDFLVGGTFIEVWGVIGNTKYNARRREKIEKYRNAGVPLIQVFPHHILDGDYSPLEVLLG
jgi:hypothetical protein